MVGKGIGIVVVCLAIFMIKASYQTRLICAAAIIGLLVFNAMKKKR